MVKFNWNKKLWLNPEGWKYIAINLVGNLFPIWFLLIINFSNNGFSFAEIVITLSQPFTYLILSVTFAASTLYLWLKKVKSDSVGDDRNKKISIGMLIYVLILFPIIGFFLSKKDCLEQLGSSCQLIIPAIYIIFSVVVVVYIYYQLSDFFEIDKLNEKSSSNPTKNVNAEIKTLNEEL